jgi:hypothetical protein
MTVIQQLVSGLQEKCAQWARYALKKKNRPRKRLRYRHVEKGALAKRAVLFACRHETISFSTSSFPNRRSDSAARHIGKREAKGHRS